MIRSLFIACISLVVICSANAQLKGAFYFEGLGAGIKITFNYDRRFGSDTDGLGFRIGVGQSWHGFSVPVQVNTLLGEDNHKLELGVGFTYFYSGRRKEFPRVASNLAVMYRYQRPNSTFFRAGFSPLLVSDSGDRTSWLSAFWPGISLGYYIDERQKP